MRNTYRHSLNQPSLSLVGLFCILSLCLFASNTPAQTLGEVKRQMQERGASPRTEAIPDNATTQQDDAAAQQENSPSRGEQRAQAIVGTWLGTLGDGTKTLITFNADGTVINSVQGGISTDPASPTHTAHHGVWRHLGGRQFGLTMWDIIYDLNTGELKLYTKIRMELRLSGNDEASARAKVEFINPQGDVVGSFSSGVTFKRIKYEPLN